MSYPPTYLLTFHSFNTVEAEELNKNLRQLYVPSRPSFGYDSPRVVQPSLAMKPIVKPLAHTSIMQTTYSVTKSSKIICITVLRAGVTNWAGGPFLNDTKTRPSMTVIWSSVATVVGTKGGGQEPSVTRCHGFTLKLLMLTLCLSLRRAASENVSSPGCHLHHRRAVAPVHSGRSIAMQLGTPSALRRPSISSTRWARFFCDF